MFEPRGPEPRAVYLRRRATVAGAAVVALVAVVWLASSLAGGGADPQPVQAASAGSMTAGAPSASVAPASSESPVSGPSGSEAAQSAAPAAPSNTAPSNTAPSNTAPSNTAPSNTAPRNVACSDQAIGVSAQVADPTYPVGGQPVFRLLIKNTGKTLCATDLGAGLQQVIVYSEDGKQRVWSSNDCFPGATPDLRTLKPDEEAVYSVQWSGNTSTEGCKTPRVPAGAGRYIAMTVLGSLQSRPVPFTIR